MRIGILGAGLIGREHLTGLRDLIDRGLVDAALAGVYDPDAERAAAARADFGIERGYDAAEALIAAPDIEVVFVTAWTGSHRDLVAACCAAHKPVFCEKPLARDLAEARAMLAAVEAAGIAHQLGLILRTSPAFGMLRQLCAEHREALGRLMAVGFRDDQYFPIQGRYASRWRCNAELAGAGTFLEHSIHDVDLMRWLFGDFDRVLAATGNFAGHRGIEDLAAVTARLASGAQVQFLSLWHQILSRPSQRRLEVFFERGRIAVEGETFGPIELELGERPAERIEPAAVARTYLQANPDLLELGLQVAAPQAVEDYRFLAAVAAGRPPEPGFAAGVAAHEVVAAAYRAAAAGCAVVLPLP